jgi:hypothetical protein
MSNIVLFDIEKFIIEMQKRVKFFSKHNQSTKAIAYDSAAEFALYCVLHGYEDTVELSVSNIERMIKNSYDDADEMSAFFDNVHGIIKKDGAE